MSVDKYDVITRLMRGGDLGVENRGNIRGFGALELKELTERLKKTCGNGKKPVRYIHILIFSSCFVYESRRN